MQQPATKTAGHYTILIVLLFLAFVPIVLMLFMSFRDTVEIYGDFWSWPVPPKLGNYSVAMLDLAGPAARTLYVCALSILGMSIFATLSAYSFARFRFVGREVLFIIIISMMMVPGVIRLTPEYVLANQLGLRDRLIGLVLFYIGAGQAFSIFMLRAFFQAQPEELFESARLDGATEWQCIAHIALPISRPVLVTIALMNLLNLYNDLIWPMLLISSDSKRTLMVALANYDPSVDIVINRPDMGIISAGYVIGTLPLLIIIAFGMKYYIRGITSGAIKA
jgi:ABC-type glycerol-3-phosphate transport system permease component